MREEGVRPALEVLIPQEEQRREKQQQWSLIWPVHLRHIIVTEAAKLVTFLPPPIYQITVHQPVFINQNHT